mmetsp:Transcript_80071/g.229834  ORF Transcript_80071/g.229834 Transcript_80071/m.229834 type:complete len:217 (+) Transcript_80071:662-1312(+)
MFLQRRFLHCLRRPQELLALNLHGPALVHEVSQLVPSRPLDAQGLASRRHHGLELGRVHAVHLLHDVVHQRAGLLALRHLDGAHLRQGLDGEAVRTTSGGATVQVVAHGQDNPEHVLDGRRLEDGVATARQRRLSIVHAVEPLLGQVLEVPHLNSQLVFWDLHQVEEEVLGDVPDIQLVDGMLGLGPAQELHLLLGWQVHHQQLDLVPVEPLGVHT